MAHSSQVVAHGEGKILEQVKSVVVAGVGGQGILLTSNIIAEAAFLFGYDVKKSEIHGMAQRGGSVISQIRFGKKVFSPLIPTATAFMILAFEKLEALRYIHFLDPQKGIVILNDYKIPPAAVLLGKEKYPENIPDLLAKKVPKLVVIDAYSEAQKLGNHRLFNVIILGVAAHFFDIPKEIFYEAIRNCVSTKFVEMNLQAFNFGFDWYMQARQFPVYRNHI
jgi:indolepyruvate ferredoxin oxidoreductase, beta subunit